MILPFLVPLLVYLELAVVFYPLVLALIFLSILFLPSDLTAIEPRRGDVPGRPTLSVFFSVLLYGLVLYHFGIDVGSWKRWVPLLGIYLVIGVVWATAKWWVFCGRVRDNVKKTVKAFEKTVEKGDDDTEVARDFMKFLIDDHDLRKYKSAPHVHANFQPWPREQVIDLFVPLVTAHKSVVLTWLFCWPMSILKWALADMLRDLYNGVFAAIKGWFQKIAAKRFSGI